MKTKMEVGIEPALRDLHIIASTRHQAPEVGTHHCAPGIAIATDMVILFTALSIIQ